MTAPSPTRPAPNTTHVEPASTLAVFRAAPIPVERPQAKTQARSSCASGAIFASAISGMTVYSANVDVPMKCRIGSPSRDRRVVPSGRRPWFCCSRIARQRFVRGSRQCAHSRHCGEKSVPTGPAGAGALARALGRDPQEHTTLDLVALALATYKAARTLSRDEVTSFLREPFVEGHAHEGGEEPLENGGMRQAIGELVTCSRCVGTWVAAVLGATQIVAPRFGRLLTWTLGAAGLNDFLQAGFAALTNKSNELEERVG